MLRRARGRGRQAKSTRVFSLNPPPVHHHAPDGRGPDQSLVCEAAGAELGGSEGKTWLRAAGNGARRLFLLYFPIHSEPGLC